MERTRSKIILMLLLLVATKAIGASYRCQIYSAYISNNMCRWKEVIDTIETSGQKPDSFLIELVNYQYGYIAWCLGNNREEEGRKYLEKAESVLEILKSDSRSLSLVYAYKSAFYGFRIALGKLAAPLLGPRSIESAREAVRIDPTNYLGYVQLGNIEFYMPSVFGGSKQEALAHYLKAEELLTARSRPDEPDWNYLSLLTVIAQSYSYTGDLLSAKKYLELILRVEPEFLWVKNELYPQVLNKLKQ